MGPNEKILRKAYAGFAKGDIASVMSLFADDVVLKSVGAPNRLDHSGEWHGLNGVRGFLAAIAENWAFRKIEMVEMIAQDDTRFVVRAALTVTSRRITGRTASIELVDFVSMNNGKCVSYVDIFDSSPLERASRL